MKHTFVRWRRVLEDNKTARLDAKRTMTSNEALARMSEDARREVQRLSRANDDLSRLVNRKNLELDYQVQTNKILEQEIVQLNARLSQKEEDQVKLVTEYEQKLQTERAAVKVFAAQRLASRSVTSSSEVQTLLSCALTTRDVESQAVPLDTAADATVPSKQLEKAASLRLKKGDRTMGSFSSSRRNLKSSSKTTGTQNSSSSGLPAAADALTSPRAKSSEANKAQPLDESSFGLLETVTSATVDETGTLSASPRPDDPCTPPSNMVGPPRPHPPVGDAGQSAVPGRPPRRTTVVKLNARLTTTDDADSDDPPPTARPNDDPSDGTAAAHSRRRSKRRSAARLTGRGDPNAVDARQGIVTEQDAMIALAALSKSCASLNDVVKRLNEAFMLHLQLPGLPKTAASGDIVDAITQAMVKLLEDRRKPAVKQVFMGGDGGLSLGAGGKGQMGLGIGFDLPPLATAAVGRGGGGAAASAGGGAPASARGASQGAAAADRLKLIMLKAKASVGFGSGRR